MKKSISILLLGASILISSCKKDVPPSQPNTGNSSTTSGGVFVLNEGNYLSSNAKLSYYNKAQNTTIIDLFSQANGSSIGDLLQSINFYNDRAYLVVNNSGIIAVCHPTSMFKLATINGFTSPRYILPVSANKAYVTDLFANKIWKVNLLTNTISGSIALNGWSEQMIEALGKVFITNYSNGKVYVLDPTTDMLTDSIVVAKGASYIQKDVNGKLWVLCTGDGALSISPTLSRIDPATNAVETTLTFSGYPSRLCINGTADTLYFLNSGVYQVPITASSISGSPLIAAGTANFYGLGIDPQTSLIYVSDAIDFIQYGKVLIYNPSGTYVKEFGAGIIPGDFWFQ